MGVLHALWNVGYAAHGYCLFWEPWLLWSHGLSDALIAAAYFSIPIVLVMLVRRRRDLAFGWVFWCFATFITACGLTHVMGIVTLFEPLYGLEAVIKVITALASVATAIALWPLLPRAVALPSSDKLQITNQQLEAMVAERDAALTALRAQVTQRENAEAALLQAQKLEAVGQLTGGIAHDFNNLLQAVAGNLELIARKPGDADNVVRWSGSALDAVDRGRALTGQLLAFSRKQRLELTSVRVADLILGMRDLTERAVAPLAKLRIEPIDRTLAVEADPLQLELAILNLAFNARDAMPEGGTLTIRAELRRGEVPPDLPRGDYVALTLADTGMGMAPDVAERALEPFFTTKGVGKGTGMGLSMAFGVVRQSGGTLTLESTPGEGTTITLYLRVATKEPARAAERDADGPGIVDLSGSVIGLVDDDDQVRGALADMMRTAGAEIREADSGEQGLAMVHAHAPDLLVVDFAMPGITGAELAKRVREDNRDLPILLVTGFADSAKLAILEGADVSVLRKPFEGRELLRRAAELLGRG